MESTSEEFEVEDGVLLGYSGSSPSVVIPDGITGIGGEAFNCCTSLAEIHFAGTKKQWDDVEKGDDWKKKTAARSVTFDKK